MAAALDDPAGFKHQDLVDMNDGVQPVREDNDGAPPRQIGHRILDQRLVFGIGKGRRLVKDQDRRILQDRAGNRDPLPLAPRKPEAAFTQNRVIALRQGGDEIMRPRRAGRRLDLGPRRPGPGRYSRPRCR